MFAELVGGKGKEVGGGWMEGERGGEVADARVREGRRGEELEGMEGGPGEVKVMKGGQVGEFLEGYRLGIKVRRADLAADLFEGTGDNRLLGS